MRYPVLLVAEAVVMLAVASLLIAVQPFRRIAALASAGRQGPAATPRQARRIEHAIEICAQRVPWRAVCFQKGLAAQFMLRRRGLAAALHYGAACDDDGKLIAHVWVRSGETDVVGCVGAARYGVLAIFPSA